MEVAAAQLIASIVAATTAVAGTALSVNQSITTSRRARQAEEAAKQKAAIEKVAADAKAKQERSIIGRHLASQIDASRVIAGAAGVSGGASQMVLESAFAADARTDLATTGLNRTFTGQSIESGYNARTLELNAMQTNPLAAAFTGVMQGIGGFASNSENIATVLTKQKTEVAAL